MVSGNLGGASMRVAYAERNQLQPVEHDIVLPIQQVSGSLMGPGAHGHHLAFSLALAGSFAC